MRKELLILSIIGLSCAESPIGSSIGANHQEAESPFDSSMRASQQEAESPFDSSMRASQQEVGSKDPGASNDERIESATAQKDADDNVNELEKDDINDYGGSSESPIRTKIHEPTRITFSQIYDDGKPFIPARREIVDGFIRDIPARLGFVLNLNFDRETGVLRAAERKENYQSESINADDAIVVPISADIASELFELTSHLEICSFRSPMICAAAVDGSPTMLVYTKNGSEIPLNYGSSSCSTVTLCDAKEELIDNLLRAELTGWVKETWRQDFIPGP